MQNILGSKRPALGDVTNTFKRHKEIRKKYLPDTVYDMLPVTFNTSSTEQDRNEVTIIMQNKHPQLAMYNAHLQTDTVSFGDFSSLCDSSKEPEMLNFFHLLPDTQQCLSCGNNMRVSKQGKTWYWICTRHVNGKEGNRGKFSVRRGTFF